MLVLALALALFGTAVTALESDRDQPIELAADSVDIDEGKGLSTYKGDVDLRQGTMRLRADVVTVYRRGRKTSKIVAEGRPVKFQQQSNKGPVKGEARRMEYEVDSENLLMAGEAVLIQGKDSMRSDRIVYDRVRAVVKAGAAASTPAWGGSTLGDAFAEFFQDHYQRMTPAEIEEALARIERKAQRRYGVEIDCRNTPPLPGVVFGYAINIAKCRGYRDCVHACVEENNLSRDTQYIRVVEMDEGNLDLLHGDHYYDSRDVPRPGKYYLPMQCMQCDNPPCVSACPVEATWMEPDGIVVVDYNWCIDCRYCEAACPYGAPQYDPSDGLVKKCNMCVDEIESGRRPYCVMACMMRVLDIGPIDWIWEKQLKTKAIGPKDTVVRQVRNMADPELTKPSIGFVPHSKGKVD